MTHIGVIGAGAFGTSLAYVLANNSNRVSLWARNANHVSHMQTNLHNGKYLPEIGFPTDLSATANIDDLSHADAILLAIPAQQVRTILTESFFKKLTAPLILCAKGIELETSATQSEIVSEILPDHPLAIITGPGFAKEIAAQKPTAMTIACENASLGRELQERLSTPTFRLYLSDDVLGAQLGGALKNVLAIACGIVDGIGLGKSAQAALMTRGFAEISRLAIAMGANPITLSGLSGFGDLVLTCSSPMSRNFSFGYTLGSKGTFASGQTFEGVATAQACLKLAQIHKQEMPIVETISQILEGNLEVHQAIDMLMARPLRDEH